VESSLWCPVFKTFGYFNDLENVLVFGCRIDFLLKELFDHFLLGCAERVGVTKYAVDACEVVVARVVRVAFHLECDIQEVYVFFLISHNGKQYIRISGKVNP